LFLQRTDRSALACKGLYIKRGGENLIKTMTTKSRFTTAIATGAVLLNALAPVALASSANDINVLGNGVNSTNNVSVNKTSATVVNQTNNANITNNVSSNASTGDNSSSFNTGGNTRIVTGDAKSDVKVTNAANLNKADLSNCGGCNGGAYNVTVEGNGVGSDNNVNLNKANETFLNQANDAYIANDVNATAKTGGNDASYNTGGDTIIVTGDAKTKVDVDNKANANFATIGGSNGHEDGSSVKIKGNGAYSDNNVALDNASAIVLDQYNNADIYNNVDADAKTGKNDAGFNTGGTVAISTGDAKTKVGVDNLVNFNAASIDCDCVLNDADVKVAENGVGSDNGIAVDAANELFNSQDNYADLGNNIDGNAKTGYNDAEFGTGSVDGDPLIFTGDSESSTDVSNGGNVNLFNNGSSVHLPGNWELGVHFDLSDLLNTLHGWN
jgi:hypothetical protein